MGETREGKPFQRGAQIQG